MRIHNNIYKEYTRLYYNYSNPLSTYCALYFESLSYVVGYCDLNSVYNLTNWGQDKRMLRIE